MTAQPRHRALGTFHLANYFARIRRNLLVYVQFIIRAANERLGKINGVLDVGHHGQPVAMADPVLGQFGFLAAGEAVDPAVPRAICAEGAADCTVGRLTLCCASTPVRVSFRSPARA